jgi:hypothetical protein
MLAALNHPETAAIPARKSRMAYGLWCSNSSSETLADRIARGSILLDHALPENTN